MNSIPIRRTNGSGEVESRLLAMADELGGKQGPQPPPVFFQTAAGMAASFVAMNEVYGPLFDVTARGKPLPQQWPQEARQTRLKGPVHHGYEHPLPARRHPHQPLSFDMRKRGRQGRLEQRSRQPRADDRGPRSSTTTRRKIFLDSETKISLISSAPSDIEAGLVPEPTSRWPTHAKKINDEAGIAAVVFSHMIFTPGQPGWLDKLDGRPSRSSQSPARATPSATIPIRKSAVYPWRMDDEESCLTRVTKKMVKGRHQERLHPQKGCSRRGDRERRFPICEAFNRRRPMSVRPPRTGPQLNFIIYHSRLPPTSAAIRSRRSPSSSARGRISMDHRSCRHSPRNMGVNNVYGDVGQLFCNDNWLAEPNVWARR